jgi:N utilization substance protein B
MGTRHTGRKLAMQIIYQAEIQNAFSIDQIMDDYLSLHEYQTDTQNWTRELSLGVWLNKADIDHTIIPYLKGWAFERINKIDLTLLRLAIFEINYLKTTPSIVINEIVEISKKYGTDDSYRFINGVLDRIAKEKCLPDSLPS